MTLIRLIFAEFKKENQRHTCTCAQVQVSAFSVESAFLTRGPDMNTDQNPNALNQSVREAWETIAPWWDEKVGAEGNVTQRLLIGPATERLLNLQPDELVLDCACGSGIFSRRMAQLGARVVAFDFSEKFLERARARTTELADRIEYRVLDATNEAQMLALGPGRFDAAVCTMAIMDMAEIAPLFSALSKLLKPEGRFVFSVMHPCFNQPGVKKIVEEEDREGKLEAAYALKISRYIYPYTQKGLGIVGQPAPHVYFHRPLSEIFNAGFRAGFVLDGLEEPVFEQPVEPDRPFSWANYREIPPHLVARMRLISNL